MNQTPSRAIVSVILEKEENGTRYVYLQTRFKPKTSPAYTGLLEIPAGGIEGYEDVLETVKREVEEETGLKVGKFIGNLEEQIEENIAGNKVKIFQPFVCQQMLSSNGGLPWVGFVFRCQVQGEIKINLEEAKDPRWISLPDLKKILSDSPASIFPLQYPVLKYYVDNCETV